MDYRAFPRPWPAPRRPWLMAQTWIDLLFAHWSVPPDVLRPLIPPGLTLDTFQGKAYVGVVPFEIIDLRLHGLPPVPGTARFPELNVRTYVIHEGKPGVWFFSLDAAHPPAVEAARMTFFLPYFHTRMAIQREANHTIAYYARRVDPRLSEGRLIVRYRPTGPGYVADAGTLDDWLTARFALYSAGRAFRPDPHGRLYRGEIAHAPWVLHPAEAEFEVNTVAQAHSIPLPAEPPLLHFVHRMDMRAWNVTPVVDSSAPERRA